jgi:voltage-gated potassium channel
VDSDGRRQALERFERATELPLVLLAVLFIPVFIVPYLMPLSPAWDQLLDALSWFIWAAFALDFIVRLALTESRLAYLRRHWLDVLIVVLPLLRPLRILQSARALMLLRGVYLGVFLGRAAVGARRVLHVPQLVLGGMVLTLVLAALVYLAERDAGGPIDSMENALWWAFVTVTTVGYGDAYPVTPEGRGLAVVLMVAGIALFSSLAASLASFIIRTDQEDTERQERSVEERIERLERLEMERLRALEEKIERLEQAVRESGQSARERP